MRWISCKDKMPKQSGIYLVIKDVFGHPMINVCNFSYNLEVTDKRTFAGDSRPGWYSYDSQYGNYEVTNVIYWHKLPRLPKDGKKNKLS